MYRDGLTEAQASPRSQSKTAPTLKLNALTAIEGAIAERDGLEMRKICVKEWNLKQTGQ